MKILGLLVAFVIATHAADGTRDGSTTVTCDDGKESGLRLPDDGENCICHCTERNTTATCLTVDDLKSAFRQPDSQQDKTLLYRVVQECSKTDDELANCPQDMITYNYDARTCECPTCDMPTTDAPDDSCPVTKYGCRYGSCVAFTKNCDDTYSTERVSDDLVYCDEICQADPIENITNTSCTEGVMGDDRCYYPCIKNRDGSGTLSDTPLKVTDVAGNYDRLATWRRFCKAFNPDLENCSYSSIVPSNDRLGCGCGTCEETCTVSRRFVYYADGDVKKCKRITCTTEEVVRTAESKNQYTAVITEERYVNIRKTETETQVDITYCTGTRSDDTTTTGEPMTTPDDYDFCDDPCDSIRMTMRDDTDDNQLCVYDSEGDVLRTYDCYAEFKCALRDAYEAGKVDRFSIKSYGRCQEETDKTDECTVGTMRVTDKRVATSKCPVMCKCIENPRGAEYANIEVCDTMERQFENLKKRCYEKLGADECRYDNLYFAECPNSDDDDICDSLFCDDGDAPDVCRKSSEGFADTTITKRNESVGCYYKECVETDDGSGQYELKEVRYDLDTTSSEGILRACPRLADCQGVLAYETNGLCGVCPTCGANETDTDNDIRCSREAVARGAEACKEDPRDDQSRPDDEEIAGRVRVRVGTRLCADRFLGYDRETIYDFFKTAALKLADACDIDVEKLRCAITGFDYEIVDRTINETNITGCEVVVVVVVQLDFSDTDLGRLRKLLACIQELDDIGVRFATQIRAATKYQRLSDDDTSTVDEEGIYASNDASYAATVVITDEDGNELMVAGTTDPGDATGTTMDNENTRDNMDNGNMYGVFMVVMFGTIASAFLF